MNTTARSHWKRISAPLLVLFVLSLVFSGQAAQAQTETGSNAKRMIGYFSAWNVYGRNYRIKDLHTSGIADMLTHINYSFGDVKPVDGQIKCTTYDYADYQKSFSAQESVDGVADTNGALRGNLRQLKVLKTIYPELKIMISIGGWTLSNYFSDASLSTTSRNNLAQSCIDLWLKGNLPAGAIGSSEEGTGGDGVGAGVFDGIDIDWEFPGTCGKHCQEDGLPNCIGTHCVSRPQDTTNFTLLLQTFRTKMNALGTQNGKRYLLTTATSANPSDYAKLQLNQIHQKLDFINVMAYDLHGAFDTKTNFNAPLMPSPSDPANASHFTVSEAMQGYLAGGVPADKLVMGVPFYGRGWKNVQTTGSQNPLYRNVTGANTAARSAAGTWQPGIDDYKVLRAKYRSGQYIRYYNETVKNAYLYNPTTKVFWSYDDPQTMREKASYVRTNNLGGVMIWELSGDTVTGELTKTIYNEIIQ